MTTEEKLKAFALEFCNNWIPFQDRVDALTDLNNSLEAILTGGQVLPLVIPKIADLEHKNKEANEFIIEIAKMLKMETDGIGFDGIRFSLDDFQEALSNFTERL